jgi:site-specific recombinase XerD
MKDVKLYRRADSPNWWSFSLNDDTGKRVQRSGRKYGLSADLTEEEAMRRLLAHFGVPLPPPVTVTPPVYTLGWLMEEAERRARRDGCRESTAREYRIALRHLAEMLGNETLLADVKKIHVSQFQDWLLRRGEASDAKEKGYRNHSAATVNKVLSTVRAAFERMVEDEVLARNPFRKFRKLAGAEKPRHFTPEQLGRFLAVVNGCGDEPLIHYIYICVAMGLRRREVLEIRRANVDLENNRVRVQNIKRREQKERWLTIPEAVRADFRWFLHRPALEPFAWCHPDTATHRVKRLIRAADVPETLHLHSLRHTFATLALQHGGESLLRVRDVMGHTDIKTTMGYTHSEADGGQAVGLGVDLDAHKQCTRTRNRTNESGGRKEKQA